MQIQALWKGTWSTVADLENAAVPRSAPVKFSSAGVSETASVISCIGGKRLVCTNNNLVKTKFTSGEWSPWKIFAV
jgi:hypothetical protein